jgi:phosphohistidine phosphatase SixA
MRKLLILFIILIPNTSFSNEKFVNYLKEGKKIIFMRHALAPGTADPKNFNINDCSTQRNLNEEGRSQSKRIGIFFKNKNIKIDKVLSSEWCRCKDTANIAFGNFQTFSALNSFYEARFAKNKSKQIKELKNFLNNWEGDSNLIIVTHFVVISELLNKGTSSGEMILTDKKLTILGNLEIN